MILARPDFLKNISYTLQVPGYIGLLTCIAALVYGEYLALLPFFGIAVFTIIPSLLLIRWLKDKGEHKIQKPLILIALSYGVVSLIGAVPLYATALLYAHEGMASANLLNLNSPLNAVFESFAGFTSSGLTMIDNPEDIPHTVQLWRSLSQWTGGLGIFILAAFIFSPGDEGSKTLIKTEVGNIFTEEENPGLINQIWITYIGFTLLGFLLFLLADQTVWVSLNHALTAVSTGGFNVTNGSFRDQPLDSKIYSMLLMVLGALGFSMYWHLLWKRDLKVFKTHVENLWFLLFLFLGILWMVVDSLFSAEAPTLTDNIYQWISAFTTSGYQTADISKWENWKILILSLSMLIGGVGGSTAGGLKIRRLMLLIYTMLYSLTGRKSKRYHDAICRYGEGEDLQEVLATFVSMLGVWLSVLVVSVLLISYVIQDAYSINEILFEVISAQSNVGLSIGITSADMHWFLKLDFILLMWMGRLELVAVIFLFKSWFIFRK